MSLLHASGIYKILNTKTGDFYIGSSVNVCARWKLHIKDLRKGDHTNGHLQNSWNKYGSFCFFFCVLEFVDKKQDLLNREQYYLDNECPAFNICKIAGSLLGTKRTKEQCDKMSTTKKSQSLEISAWMKGNKNNLGKKLSDGAKRKISVSMMGNKNGAGTVLSDKAKKLISMKAKGHKRNLGHHFTLEQKNKMSIAQKGKILSEEHKRKLREARRNYLSNKK